MPEQEYSSFIRALFGLSSLSPVPADLSTDPKLGNIEWFDPTLNESQKDAVRFALASTEIALVHGPPGVRLPTSYVYHLIHADALTHAHTHLYRRVRRTP